MGWAEIAKLIIAVGLPAAESIWKKWAAGKDPEQADWDELKILTSRDSKYQMLRVLQEQGIDPESEQGQGVLGSRSIMAANENVRWADGTLDFSLGVDSNRPATLISDNNPNGLPRNAYAWGITSRLAVAD